MPDSIIPKNEQMTKNISRRGKPITKPSRTNKNVDSRLGKHPVMSKIKINYDPTEDMPDEEWGFQ
jgi:hypothetical protein